MENKVSEKIYVLDDDTEMILLSYVMFNDVRYLLLSKSDDDEDYSVAYEDSGDLVFVDESEPDYFKILDLLIEEINKNI